MIEPETISLRHLISACLDLAEKGGDIARQVVRSGFLDIKEKRGPEDLFTVADLRVQAEIVGSLLKLWPNLTIVGEESVTPDGKVEVDLTRLDNVPIDEKVITVYPVSQVTVYIDPIDATMEFTKGNYSHVTTLIGIVVNDESIAGVIYQPWSQNDNESPKGCLCWGILGHGVSGLGPQEPRDNLVAVVTRTKSHTNEKLEQALKNINPSEIIRVGGTGYKSLLVAQGKADVFISMAGTSKWDICAAEAIIRSTGGELTDLNGNRVNYNSKEPVANKNGVVASRLIDAHKGFIEKINT